MSKVVILSSDRNGRKNVETRVPACKLEFKGENDGEDRISKLPDELIVQILSLLTIRELMCTSVLSRRWKYMWTYAYNLNFDATKILHDCELRGSANTDCLNYPRRYVNMIRHIMSSHQPPSVDSLRIRFDFGFGRREHADEVVRWIVFAIEKRVKSLEIDLSSSKYFEYFNPFPYPISDFESLVELRLVYLNVTGESLESILLSCLLLERLTVGASDLLVNLNITGPSLQLKYLEIFRCPYVEKIEINAENLRTLKYSGPNIKFALNNTPFLEELSFGGDFCRFFIDNIPQFSSHLPRLEMLGLDMLKIGLTTDFRYFPMLSNLKRLEVKVKEDDDKSLLGLISLLKLSPLLQKFSLWLCCCPRIRDREIKEAEKFRLDHLKVVEFHGFIGRAIDIELATYFIENAVALEKIVIYRRDILFPESVYSLKETRAKISARKHARLLGKRLPRDVTMVIN